MKGSRFPVRRKRDRAVPHAPADEEALLLDPCVDDPQEHLAFGKFGEVAPRSERGDVTIQVFGLDREALVAERRNATEQAYSEIPHILTAISQKRGADAELKRLANPALEYAAARRSVLQRAVLELEGEMASR